MQAGFQYHNETVRHLSYASIQLINSGLHKMRAELGVWRGWISACLKAESNKKCHADVPIPGHQTLSVIFGVPVA